jgi:Rrf2 family nitric oxide-sensitive transcriptional repressor
MRLTVYTDFSLRVLMYVALHPERLPTIGEIATSYGISRNHLMKVVYELGVAGYLETVRGKHGGVRLARATEEIVLGDVVRHSEPDMVLVPCFDEANALCVITPACKLRSALHEARSAFLKVLDAYTLADLVRNKAALRGLLAAGTAMAARPAAAGPATSPGASRTKRIV